LEKLRDRWEDNIKMGHRKIELMILTALVSFRITRSDRLLLI
jgi:hypothetical protein